ncbi:hypothetical protein AAFF_G00339540 [Aldrovandia affinis]|uniref:Uncharacterized protein n=1 Tax=Aldrovandia affinis TaxID=143900 RepID=A0AAD7SMF7_9TELE|nr:hypothetical protein AAFF_G00339540 [Aldrovandia affinis]
MGTRLADRRERMGPCADPRGRKRLNAARNYAAHMHGKPLYSLDHTKKKKDKAKYIIADARKCVESSGNAGGPCMISRQLPGHLRCFTGLLCASCWSRSLEWRSRRRDPDRSVMRRCTTLRSKSTHAFTNVKCN